MASTHNLSAGITKVTRQQFKNQDMRCKFTSKDVVSFYYLFGLILRQDTRWNCIRPSPHPALTRTTQLAIAVRPSLKKNNIKSGQTHRACGCELMELYSGTAAQHFSPQETASPLRAKSRARGWERAEPLRSQGGRADLKCITPL
eukprot:751670-Hanusia_phi.AAC.3